ncbi:MAG TPA: tetratricopeptide repeat protein [Tepidisphaeraceae bacterium]|jgi:tetratricopeptide (TPR) repeat protein
MPSEITPEQQAENRKRAEACFARGKTLADIGSYEQAIDTCIQGLHFDPDNVEGHQHLRRIALERKAHGGRDIAWAERMKLPAVKQQMGPMLAAEKLLAYTPDDRSRMTDFFKAAEATGAAATAAWVRLILKTGRG